MAAYFDLARVRLKRKRTNNFNFSKQPNVTCRVQTTAGALPTSINYQHVAVSVDLICFRICFFFIDLYFLVCIFFLFHWLSWPASISTATCGARGLRINCKLIKYCCCCCYQWYRCQTTFINCHFCVISDILYTHTWDCSVQPLVHVFDLPHNWFQ